MKKFILIYKTKLCSLLWMFLGFEALVVIYLLTPAPIDPLVVIEPNFASLSGDNLLYEEGKPARYTVSVSKNLDKELHVTLAYGGGATKGIDYHAPDTVVIKKGDMNTTFEIRAIDDNELEGEELISVKIVKIDGKNFMEALRPQDLGGVVFTRMLDEAKHQRKVHQPTLLSVSCSKELMEDNRSISCHINSSQKSYEPLVITLDFKGTAVRDIDYKASKTVIIPANKKSASFQITSIDDAYKEGAEEIIVTVASVYGGGFEESVVAHKVAKIALRDELQTSQETLLSLTNIEKIEEGGRGTYRLSLSRAPLSDVTVFIKRNTSATKFNIPERVVFHKGERTKTFSIETVDDNIKEKRDFIDFSIAKVEQKSFERLSYSNSAVKTMVIDEDVPVKPDSETAYLSLDTKSTEHTFNEGSKEVIIVVTASEVLHKDALMTLALDVKSPQGRNYTLKKKLLIKKGERQGQTTLTIQDDNIKQAEERLEISILRHDDGGLEDLRVKAPMTLLLRDNKDGNLSTTLSLRCPERLYENAQIAKCRLSLSAVSKEDITVTLSYSGDATQDKDYVAPTVVTVPKGTKTKSFSIKALDDVINEGEESIVIALTSAEQNYFETLTLQERDVAVLLTDEKRPSKIIYLTLKVNKSVAEGSQTKMTLVLSEPALKDVVVTLDMPQSSDYSRVEQVVIPQGKQSVSFDVATINDNFIEKNEYVVASIKSISQDGFERLSFDKRAHRVLIVDDESSEDTANFSFNSVRQKLYEDEKSASINLTLSQPTQQAMRVYLKGGGVASENVDYTMPKSVVIKKGKTDAVIAISPINDNIIEKPESIVVTVEKAQTGGLEVVEVGQSYTLSLVDEVNSSHSPAANVTLTGPPSVSESKLTKAYIINVSQKVSEDLTLFLGYGGDATERDYRRVEKVTVPKGANRVSFRIETIDNDTAEHLRVFSVAIVKAKAGGLENIVIDKKVVKTSITDEVDIARAFELIVKDQVISFDLASTEINEDAKIPLNKITDLFKQFPSARLTVEGHTNALGSAESNLVLSQKRANSIKRYLVSQGIEKRRIRAIGYGESRPLLDNDSKEAMEFNKRVEFRVVY